MVSASSEALYQAEDLWHHIFCDERGVLALGYTQPVEGADFHHEYFDYPEEAEQAAERARKLSEAGYNVWHCAHLLTGRRRVKENAAPITALYVDGDGAMVPDWLPQPTAVVVSSPGREQLYWRLSMPVPPEVGENLNRRLAYAMEADTSGWDLSQLLRPPGTRNYKYEGTPTVEVEDLEKIAYDADEFDKLLPPLPEAMKENEHATNEDGDEPPVQLDPEALRVWRGERPKLKDDGRIDRSRSLVKIGRVLYDAGANRAVIVKALQERDLALSWECYTNRRDADKQYHAIVTELEENGRTKTIPINLNGSSKNAAGKTAPPTHDELRDRWIDHNPHHSYGLGEWRRYEAGIWPLVSETAVKAEISSVIEAAKPEGVKPTASILASVTELARVKVFVPDEKWDADPDILVCRNGALRISASELVRHRPGNYATSMVPYDYDPEATPVMWFYFLNHTVPVVAAFLQEFAGYALTTDTSHELAVWLQGPRGSGKSTFVAGLQAMLGHRAGVLGLADLERSRFTLADLPGKTLVVAREQPAAYLASTDVLDTIISGEPLQVERKYRDPYTVIPHAKVCWAMNELPRVANATSGIFRRVKVVTFPELPEDQRDPKIKKAIEQEGAGILNWALEGLRRLKERGHFEIPQSVQEATAEFEESNDVPAAFLEAECIREEDSRVTGQSLYDAYDHWCKTNNHKPLSSTRIPQEWRRLGLERKRVKGLTYYYGVRLKLPSERRDEAL
jgi:P4 family phage/plasmid primase-like protien